MTEAGSNGRSLVCSIDIGGTFTDCVLVDEDGRMAYGKALSSPGDEFESGFFGSIEAAAAALHHTLDSVFGQVARVISHGSTVGTNIVVEGKGARVGLLTTRGHEDTFLMMRGLGRVTGEPPENVLKVTETSKPDPLVPRSRIRGITERVDFEGTVVVALAEDEVERAVSDLLADGCDAFAICFLWSIQNPDHELRAREIVRRLAPDAFVSVSHELSRAVGEYERTVATVINAFIGPKTQQYLDRVQRRLSGLGFGEDLLMMQTHGGMVPVDDGANTPVLTIGSGPVGGLIGTQRIARELGIGDVIATDMGGTSFDVGIVKDGEPLSAQETVLGKYQYKIPAIEVVSIGAGGGSIAWIEPHSRTLRVGPQSAGSNPGPACYGLGGSEPTVTDANLLLGYLDPDVVFGTARDRQIKPDVALAEQAVRKVAGPLGLDVTEAALGIVEIVNSKMANLLENVVIGRGFDPRDFVLLAYGGGGPLHAAGYARELGISRIVIPGEVASVWSAFGIAMSDIRYELERDVVLLSPFDAGELERAFGEMEREARTRWLEKLAYGTPSFGRFVRMRYQWQRHELEVPLAEGAVHGAVLERTIDEFNRRYESRYGSAALLPEARYEIVSLRLEPVIEVGIAAASRAADTNGAQPEKPARVVHFERGTAGRETPVYRGEALRPGSTFEGPAVIDLPTTGILVPPRASVERTASGDFVLELRGE